MSQRKVIKILSSKQILQKSLTRLPHVKAANASENLVHLVKFDKLCINCMKQIKFSKKNNDNLLKSA